MKILFLHGWQSIAGSTKPTFLADHGHEVFEPALPDLNFTASIRLAQDMLSTHKPDLIVGSSRGGAVAMNMDSGETGMVLLCPAWKLFGQATSVKKGTIIIHSRRDEIVPFADSEELVQNSRLPASALVDIGSDHRLADPIALAALLKICEQRATTQPDH